MLALSPDAIRDDLTPAEALLWTLQQQWLFEEKDVGGTWAVFGLRGKKRVFVYHKSRVKAWRQACDHVRLLRMIPPTPN